MSEMMETNDFIKIVDSFFPNDIDHYLLVRVLKSINHNRKGYKGSVLFQTQRETQKMPNMPNLIPNLCPNKSVKF